MYAISLETASELFIFTRKLLFQGYRRLAKFLENLREFSSVFTLFCMYTLALIGPHKSRLDI